MVRHKTNHLLCIVCERGLHGQQRKFCSINCKMKDWYMSHKEIYKKYSKEWAKNNPERYKILHNKAMKKHIKTDKFRKSVIKNYYNNKDKWKSRSMTKYFILSNNIHLKNKCGHYKDIEIHHEIYPTKKQDIIKAIKEEKIYYLCRKCHKSLRFNTS